MAEEGSQWRNRIIRISIVLTLLGSIAAWVVSRWRALRAQRLRREAERVPPALPVPESIQGLSEAEAKKRRSLGQDNTIEFAPRRTRKKILRESTISIFNLDLLGLAFAQLLLGQAQSALISLGVMCINIGVNVFQQLIAKKRLDDLEMEIRPRATVIREGQVRSIDPNEIVLGDALVVGPGDQFMVDGEMVGEGDIVVDETVLAAANGRVSKRAGDQVYAGSFCLSGHGAYKAEKVGDERLVVSIAEKNQAGKQILTPLQSIIAGVLKVMLVLVILFSTLLFVRYFRSEVTGIDQLIINATSLIFSLAPPGLFFMVLVGYAMGSADLAKLGALVHQAESVETLANVNVLCLSNTGAVTGIKVELDVFEDAEDETVLSEDRIHHILGISASSTSHPSSINRALKSNFKGAPRAVYEEAPFLSAYGWSAISFDDDDLRGVYVLGNPEILSANLRDQVGESDDSEDDESSTSPRKNVFQRMGVFFRRGGDDNEAGVSPSTEEDRQEISAHEKGLPPNDDPPTGSEEDLGEGAGAGDQKSQEEDQRDPSQDKSEPDIDAQGGNVFKRLFKRAGGLLGRSEPDSQVDETNETEPPESIELMFAYRPDLPPLNDPQGRPQLPEELILLGRLNYIEQIRPDAEETIRVLLGEGLQIKIFSADSVDDNAALIKLIRVGEKEESLGIITGEELVKLDDEQFAEKALKTTVFCHLTPDQKAAVVGALRENGQQVAMVGDGVDDVAALRQADLGITSRAGSRAALSIADIVLLKDSLKVLLGVLEKGQRIVNGLMDVLKLYLTQIMYLTLLLVMVAITANGLPYLPSQGSLIAVLTLTIPAVFITFWAPTGAVSSARMSGQLAQFVLPAGLTISLAGLAIFLSFLLNSSDLQYAQLAVTYTLIGAGLLLVVFAQPPTMAWVGGDEISGDNRPSWLVIGLFIIFFVMVPIPLAKEAFTIDFLREAKDYLIIGLVLFLWVFGVRLAWHLRDYWKSRSKLS